MPQPSQPSQRALDRSSLQDLAKLAATPPPPSAAPASSRPSDWGNSGNHSGIVDLQAIAQADPNAAQRAQSTPLASQGLFDDEAPASAPPTSSNPVSGAYPSSPASAPNSAIPGSVGSRASGIPQAFPNPSITELPSGPPSAPASAPVSSAPVSSAPVSSAPVSSAAVSAAPASAGLMNDGITAPVSQPVAAPASFAPPASQTQEPKSGRGVLWGSIIGAVVVAGAAAAGGVMYLRSQGMPILSSKQYESSAKPAAKTANAEAPSEPAAQAGGAAAEAELDEPNETPAAESKATAKAKVTTKPAAKPAPMAKGPSRGNVLASANDNSGKKPQAVTPAPKATTGLGAAMAKAAGPLDPTDPAATKTAAPKFAPGSRPQKPSKGSVLSSVGQVLPKARQCLDPDDPVAKATIIFESEGSVKDVKVSGGPKSAEGCIVKALKGAKVSPFAEPTFSASVKVRP